jgi:hypothetical protein
LIQDRPVLGGNNSTEVRVNAVGSTNCEPYPLIGTITSEIATIDSSVGLPSNDEKKLNAVIAETNIDLYLNHRGNDVEMNGTSIVAVIAESTETGERLRFTAQNFADCTGDGCIGFLAGADWEISLPWTLDGRKHMGRTNFWTFRSTGVPQTFPSCPWALPIPTDDYGTNNTWNWESGFAHDPFEKNEYIRDWNFRANYGAWDSNKNQQTKYPNHLPEWQAYVSGKRESRRLLGDIQLTHANVTSGYVFDDGCVPTGWSVDMHHPKNQPDFACDEYRSYANQTDYPLPYWIPYRCLYSRNIDNLFMAGRHISVTHVGLGSVRVMLTTGMMGEIVGMAAAICKDENTTPRGVYTDYLPHLFSHMTDSDPPFVLHNHIGPNYALSATATASSEHSSGDYPAIKVNNGISIPVDNADRWVNSAEVPNWVELTFDSARYISAYRIVSGQEGGSAPVEDFVLQYHNGSDWVDISETQTTGNAKADWTTRFPSVQSDRFRLYVTKTPGDMSRIFEFELYHPQMDLDEDGLVGIGDLAVFAGQWLIEDTDLSADFDATQNDKVDLEDFNLLSEFWGW